MPREPTHRRNPSRSAPRRAFRLPPPLRPHDGKPVSHPDAPFRTLQAAAMEATAAATATTRAGRGHLPITTDPAAAVAAMTVITSVRLGPGLMRIYKGFRLRRHLLQQPAAGLAGLHCHPGPPPLQAPARPRRNAADARPAKMPQRLPPPLRGGSEQWGNEQLQDAKGQAASSCRLYSLCVRASVTPC
jgi:hypothetical protein